MLLFLPESATCTTDFSSFPCFSVTVFRLLGGVSYFPKFPKLSISPPAYSG